MQKSYLTIGGKEYRVEVNWNALTAFLEAVGRDTLEGLSSISGMKPSEISALIAASINEGERLEGRESKLTAQDIGATLKLADVTAFMNIYIDQSRAQMDTKEPKKEDGESQES